MKKLVKFEFTIDVLVTNIPDNVTAEIDLSLGELGDCQAWNLRQSTWPPPGYHYLQDSASLVSLGSVIHEVRREEETGMGIRDEGIRRSDRRITILPFPTFRSPNSNCLSNKQVLVCKRS
jgi:hypothetical protein